MKIAIILGLFFAPQLVYPQFLFRIKINSLAIDDTVTLFSVLSEDDLLSLETFVEGNDSLFISISYSDYQELTQLINSILADKIIIDLSNYFPECSFSLLRTFDGYSLYPGIFFEKRKKMPGRGNVTLLLSTQQNIRLIEPFYNYKRNIHGEERVEPLDPGKIENLHHYIFRLHGAPMFPRRKK